MAECSMGIPQAGLQMASRRSGPTSSHPAYRHFTVGSKTTQVGVYLYNYRMRFQHFPGSLILRIMLIVFGMGAFHPPAAVRADEIQPAPSNQFSAY